MANDTLQTRNLGNTDIELTVFGVGGFLGLLVDDSATKADCERAAIDAVRRAYELGVRYFDTAPGYGGGEAERHLGLGLREFAPDERSQLRISTKVGTHPGKTSAIRCGFDTVVTRKELGASFQ